MITRDEFMKWNHQVFTRNGPHREMRYGQSFCEHFGIQDNELYNEQDYHKAAKIVSEKYISV